MRWVSQISFYLKSFFLKRKLDEQSSEEIQAHVDLATKAKVAAGMSPEEARYAALREFGNVASVRERTRDERGWVWLEQFIRDIRFAFRSLSHARGFALTVVLIFALCVAANLTIFAFVDQVLLRPLPFFEADRLVTVYDSYPKGGVVNGGVSPLHYFERTAGIAAFSETAAWFGLHATFGGAGAPEPGPSCA